MNLGKAPDAYDRTYQDQSNSVLESADKQNVKSNAAFVQLKSYVKAALPAQGIGRLIFVTDDTGGATPAFSDGTNWRRTADRNVIS